MKQRWLRTPVALMLGGAVTFAINGLFMQPMYVNDLREMGMEKYYELDLDADMMRKDLTEIGIDVPDVR